MANNAPDPNVYYVPHGSKWPLVGSVMTHTSPA